ncbi:SMC-Scp complex subunit ScpB [Lignipirellula cremea]|uniref:Segregation and condensation protein B n=1 Tax=Lignipirellula cremea TaxID=2528010 RepID=A0A518DU35_9BACT|nr:SMC-Scp complex subunit ScpB [Lignipirellula cremea]QDU95344.1 hypothetical protein Pla8534_31590 [Lignipirellula cremea]
MQTPPPDDQGLSLEDLSQAYAQLIGAGEEPYEEPKAEDELEEPADVDAEQEEEEPPDDACEVTPRSILEAILFVGHPENESLSSKEIASLMRGVRAEEIDELVLELNQYYTEEGAPYQIASIESGYRLVLRSEFSGVREQFYGRVKDAKLSQATIDVLSLVAYGQPLTKEQLEKSRNKPSGGILNQLVRRGLLRLERTEDKPRKKLYYTTDRFLELFGLDSLNDLPRSQDLERL